MHIPNFSDICVFIPLFFLLFYFFFRVCVLKFRPTRRIAAHAFHTTCSQLVVRPHFSLPAPALGLLLQQQPLEFLLCALCSETLPNSQKCAPAAAKTLANATTRCHTGWH